MTPVCQDSNVELIRASGEHALPRRQARGVDIAYSEPHPEPHTLSSLGPTVTPQRDKLGQWLATAICGNDITSSCLYVAAIVATFAGWLAPVCLLIVAAVLYLYRQVYAEVVGALPLNGGAYNALLNSTTKFKASIAACMTILSYMATSVISAKTAVEYFGSLVHVPVIPVTIAVLGIFTLLAILGITESARVAVGIFTFHMVSLTLLAVIGGWYALHHTDIISANLAQPFPGGRSLAEALFIGVSVGLLGISGFESSANFVEEQRPGVFPKTLRNMWVAVSVLNPLMALIALGVLPLAVIVSEEQRDFLLASLGQVAGGPVIEVVIVVDATLVLCGAVLTSFVGVSGLVRRMALDRCLPQLLLRENRRGTNHRIFLVFLALCASIVLLTQGDTLALAGVYTISFLCVMTLFAIGNMLLKVRRGRLPRPSRAGWLTVLLAAVATSVGLVGNILVSPSNLVYFATYFIPTALVVGLMFMRTHLLNLVLVLVRGIASSAIRVSTAIGQWVIGKLDEINSQVVIFFTRGDNLATLNSACLYVRKNEFSQRLKAFHFYDDAHPVPERLEEDLRVLDEVYPEIKIELVLRKGSFTPESIEQISREFGVPKNYMFIGAPSDRFEYTLENLGGVRVIV